MIILLVCLLIPCRSAEQGRLCAPTEGKSGCQCLEGQTTSVCNVHEHKRG